MCRFIALLAALAFGVVTACAPSPTGSTPETAPPSFKSPYFDVTVTGSGTDIILMPGLASSGAVWDQTVAALKNDHTLHVVQVSGFAGAPANGNADNENILDDLARDLSAYTNHISGSPILIGHSLGGLVAMKTALQPDAQLKHLVIVDVLPFFSVLMDPTATSESIAPISAMMKATLLAQSDDVFAQRQSEALSLLVKGEADLQKALSWSIESDRAVMAQAMSEVLVTDLRAEVANITVPTLILYARDDATANMNSIEDFYQTLYALIPNHKLIAIDDALHFVMLDQPVAFLEALQTVLMEP